ncbi:MAG: hypothetical protein WBN96_06985 [Gammaproteobacteria bacterium]
MAVAKKKTVVKNSAIASTIENSVSNLEVALDKADRAVTVKSAESKKLLNETRRLKKRRTTLMGKKKRATAANRKNSTGDSRKLLRSVTSELAATNKVLVKATAARQAVLEELSGLKDSQKMLAAYVKGISAADRAIAKSKKKRRVKRK